MVRKIATALIEDWRLAWRFWSVRLGMIGTFLTGLFIAFPDSALYFWGAMPHEVKALLPPRLVPMIGVFVFGASIVARFFKQKKVEAIKQERSKNANAQ